MKLAVLQAQADVGRIDDNLQRIAEASREAAANGADLLLTPELFVCGYAPARAAAIFTPQDEEHAIAALAKIARDSGIALVASLPLAQPDGRTHIGAVLFDAEGTERLRYSKVHLFGDDERAAFAPADRAPKTVRIAEADVSLIVCYDIEFPEMARAAADAGAQLLLVPTALTVGFDPVQSVLIPARALENHIHVAYSNHTGVEDGLEFSGNSVIADPFGATLARGNAEDAIIYADIDPAATRRASVDVPYGRDRRPGLYETWRAERH